MYGRDSIVIPNGIDTKLFKPNEILREEFRNKFRLSEDEIVIGYVARFVPQKNHILLLKIARRLPRNVRIIFVGEGQLEEKYRYLVYKLGMKRKIIFLKKLTNKDLAAFYNGIDIYAHPSSWEGFGLPLVETQSSGKPTIAFDKTAMREVILNNKTGFLVKNDKEFEEYLFFLINNEKIRRIFGRNASEFSRNFDWNKICMKYEKLFKRVVGMG
jgi:glycosyltransferase involved in cell wall biosynthesis